MIFEVGSQTNFHRSSVKELGSGLFEGYGYDGPVASLGVPEEYRHEKPGVCLSDGKTEAEGIPS